MVLKKSRKRFDQNIVFIFLVDFCKNIFSNEEAKEILD